MTERIICNDNGGELREEIVRCRNCAFYSVWDVSTIYGNHDHDVMFCTRWIDGMRMEVEPDGFCAWAKRGDA